MFRRWLLINTKKFVRNKLLSKWNSTMKLLFFFSLISRINRWFYWRKNKSKMLNYVLKTLNNTWCCTILSCFPIETIGMFMLCLILIKHIMTFGWYSNRSWVRALKIESAINVAHASKMCSRYISVLGFRPFICTLKI